MENLLTQKLDRLLIELNDIRVQIAHIDAKLSQHIEHTIPKIERLSSDNAKKIRELELSDARTQIKVGLWGGLAGVAAMVWQVISLLT